VTHQEKVSSLAESNHGNTTTALSQCNGGLTLPTPLSKEALTPLFSCPMCAIGHLCECKNMRNLNQLPVIPTPDVHSLQMQLSLPSQTQLSLTLPSQTQLSLTLPSQTQLSLTLPSQTQLSLPSTPSQISLPGTPSQLSLPTTPQLSSPLPSMPSQLTSPSMSTQFANPTIQHTSSTYIPSPSPAQGLQMFTSPSNNLVPFTRADVTNKVTRKCVRCKCPNCISGQKGTPDKPKQHICHIPSCGKVYGKTSHLKAHLLFHAGQRPFVCNWRNCNRSFTRSDELQRHLRTHTGEKRFGCEECGKRFTRSDHLSKHMQTHRKNKEVKNK